MDHIPSNTAIFSPQGFLPIVRAPGTVVEVPAGAVWGKNDVVRLRTAGLVRVGPPAPDGDPADVSPPTGSVLVRPGSGLGPDDLALRTVFWLALAGVPVSGAGLSARVRARLEPGLLELLDRVDPVSMTDPGARELLSLQLRRRARTLAWRRREQPVVAVLLPGGALPAQLEEDLASQTWPAALRCPLPEVQGAAHVLAQARQQGALYCARMTADVRYGPHHLADLAAALRHSGARVARSPLRFRSWRLGSWLEDESLGIEGAAGAGLPGGSLWYAADGPNEPVGLGYAVHGANAVPAGQVTGSRPTALRLHHRRPVVLDWLPDDLDPQPQPGDEPTAQGRGPVPRSYFVGTGARSVARSATTASES